jgi:hypothetical protein
MGNWLSLKQAQTLLNTPDTGTLKGLRDRAIIAVLPHKSMCYHRCGSL